MKLQTKHSVLLIGGQDAGKSNFLFRFWLRLEQQKGLLVRNGLPSDMEYLRVGSEELLNGTYAGHTSRDVHQQCVIPIKSAGNSSAGELTIPDCNGEKFNQIYEKREWGPEWDDLIEEGTGCLLFLRPNSDQIVTPLDWITFHQLFTNRDKSAKEGEKPILPVDNMAAPDAKEQILPPEKESEPATPEPANVKLSESGSQPSPTSSEEHPRVSPTQVVLVEWMQFLRQVYTEKVSYGYRPRIGIVVSAWDLVPHDQQSDGPTQYLKANFPLLAQFIASNPDRFDIQCFGVSVTGGDLVTMPGYKQQYINGNPQDAGFVLHELSGKPEQVPDHTLPVAWALDLLPDQSK
jgi:hypothetical protein